MERSDEVRQLKGQNHVGLFDRDGLPWTSRVHWGILLFWLAVIWFVLAPFVGVYLGIWLISKGRSAVSLILYLALAVLWLPAIFVPFPSHGALANVATALGVLILILWVGAASVLRRSVMLYYSGREGIPFPLNPALTALFGPWYVGGRLRADFPLDESGKVGAGTLKLIV